MREIKRSALVAQPPSRLFALINDIDSYPRFLPWCTHALVRSRTEREIVAAAPVLRRPGAEATAGATRHAETAAGS